MKSGLPRILVTAVVLGACADEGGGGSDAGTSVGTSEASGSSGSVGSSGDDGVSTSSATVTGEPEPTGGSASGGATTGAEVTTSETGETGDGVESRCVQTAEMITCPKLTVELGPWMRDVHYQVPLGEPPAGGWPVVLMFQGSFFSAEVTWTAAAILPFGAYDQTLVVKTLLDHGYAVVTPEAKLDGGTFWDTNVPPYSVAWETSEDHAFMLTIFAAIEEGTFGPLALDRWYATGVSSGGYMTSRMAVSYAGKFRSLAIAAASYATCSGPLCNVPAQKADHPPTLFVHGEVDATVPLVTAIEYRDALAAAGVDTRLVTDPDEGHGWIPAAPAEVLQWFVDHP